ncbi:MAG: PmoA family protein [Verrucomicrobiota bacterium]
MKMNRGKQFAVTLNQRLKKFRYLHVCKVGTVSVFLTIFSGFHLAGNNSATAAEGVHITELTNRLRVEIDGKLFTEYFFKDVPKPYLYPIIGPGDARMTRNYPMQEMDSEEHDHPHHRSLWFAHGDMNGEDFWSEKSESGKTVHEKFLEIKSGKEAGVIRSQNKWVAKNGTVVATDERTIGFSGNATQKIIDYAITLHASNGDLKMGDTKEGTMAIRVAETMRLSHSKDKKGDGHIVNSEGVRDGETWGKRAKWCDYFGPVDGKTVGVAMFDHPKNPRYPTWWHVRDYGLFAANPYGLHDFEKKPKGAGDFVITAGKSVTYRYRFVFHEGDEKQAGIEHLFKKYSSE